MATKPFPILFIAPTRIGDAVLTSGLLRRLASEISNARFTVVASPVSAPLFAEIPDLDRLIVMDKEKGGGHWFKLWTQVRGRQWGLVLDRRGSGLSRFLRARRRAVFRRTGGPQVHKVIESARLLKLEDEPPPPYLFTNPETEARAAQLLAPAGEAPVLAIGPAANWVGKTWPDERFAMTAIQLMAETGPFKDGRLLILGGPEDWRAAETLRRVLPRDRVIDITGKADLLTVYACLKRARMFIGNDSGLMHLAAAAGAPTVGLFGPSSEELYGPWGADVVAVRGPRSFEQIKALDPQLNQPIRHMLDLPVDKVIEAARTLFAKTEPEPIVEIAPQTLDISEAASPPPEPAKRGPRKRTAKAKKEPNPHG